MVIDGASMAAAEFEPGSLIFLIPIFLIGLTATFFALLVVKHFGFEFTGQKLVMGIVMCALIPVADLLHEIVGEWMELEEIVAALFGVVIAVAASWPISYAVKSWRRRRNPSVRE